MKAIKIIVAAAAICASGTALAQHAHLKGEIRGMGNGEINISYYEGPEEKRSKIAVTEGKFAWTGNLKDPQKVSLMFPKRTIWLYMEPGNMQMSGHIDSLPKVKLTGSKIQQESDDYDVSMAPLSAKQRLLLQRYGKGSKEEQLAIEQGFQELGTEMRRFADQYIMNHPESAFSLSLLTERARNGEYNDVKSAYGKLGESVKGTAEGKRLADRLTVLQRSAVGTQAFDFTQNDPEGKPVSFSAFKGKYVLLDFWASWCHPCRQENPNVLKAYNNYKDQNFTVVGISLDDKIENWKKAIQEDALPWTQLSDLKGARNAVSQYYGISAIPSTLLVGPDGKIIAKNLRGAILTKKLEEIFKNKS